MRRRACGRLRSSRQRLGVRVSSRASARDLGVWGLHSSCSLRNLRRQTPRFARGDSFLHARDQLAHLCGLCAMEIAADDETRRDLGDELLDLELVHTNGLSALDEVDDVRRQREHRCELDGTAERDDLGAQSSLVEVLTRDAWILCRDLLERRRARRSDEHHPAAPERQLEKIATKYP